jgi:transposase-like protein
MVKNQFKENEMSETRKRAKYTLEFKMEAVRLVKGGQAVSVTAKVLGIPKASLDNWVKLSAKGQLKGAGDKPVSAEQMELARLRAQLARVTMERDILKKPRRTSRGNLCEVRLDSQQQSQLAHHPGLRGSGREHQRLL